MTSPSQLAKDIAAAKQSPYFRFGDVSADLVFLSSGDAPKLFRVVKSQLAARSTVFRHMLGLLASRSDDIPAEERFDGLPVVQLAETSATLFDFLDFFLDDIPSLRTSAR